MGLELQFGARTADESGVGCAFRQQGVIEVYEEARMRPKNPYDYKQLRLQGAWQVEHHWDLELDIDWSRGIDLSKPFSPLDEDHIAFPGASAEQALALSQFMGLVINSTIAELEEVANKLRDVAWRDILRDHPVNPEMMDLGELFFAEEAKHSLAFKWFEQQFCVQTNVEPKQLRSLLPQAYGSHFESAIIRNSKHGGHAFWWVVALVEEVSVALYQQMHKHRKQMDPLFHEIHLRHFEEESKHTNYAFLMLDVIHDRARTWRQKLHLRTDLMMSEVFSSSWVLSELHRFLSVRELKGRHPFYDVLASCVPLLEKLGKRELMSRLFISAPYISLMLNRNYHRLTKHKAKAHKAIRIPYPAPQSATLISKEPKKWLTSS